MKTTTLKQSDITKVLPKNDAFPQLKVIDEIDNLARQIELEVGTLRKFKQLFQASQKDLNVNVYVFLIIRKFKSCTTHVNTLVDILTNHGIEISFPYLRQIYQHICAFEDDHTHRYLSPLEIDQFLQLINNELDKIQARIVETDTNSEKFKKIDTGALDHIKTSVLQYFSILSDMLKSVQEYHHQNTFLQFRNNNPNNNLN